MSFKSNVRSIIKFNVQLHDMKRVFKLLKPFILKQRRSYVILLFLMGLDIFLTITFAWFYGSLTNTAIKANFVQIKSLIPIGLLLLILSLASHFMGLYYETKA
jgi:ATP-binding cassette, subfamily B, bacterial